MIAALGNLKKRVQPNPSGPAKPAARQGPQITLPAGTPVPLPPAIVRALRKVVARHTRVKLLECVALLLAVLPALWLFQATADWWFNLPWLVRFILLLGDLGAAGFIVYRFAIEPLRRRMTLEGAALRVENEIPEFRSALISAVELAAARPGTTQGSLGLVKELLARVTAKVQSFDLARRVVKTANLKKWSKWALVAVIAAGAATGLAWPKSIVLIQRILLSRAPLPTRTVVIPVTRDESTVVGADVTLAAKAEGTIPRSGMLFVVYANNDRQEIPVSPSTDDPSTFSVTMQNIQQPFTYHFALNDGVGAEFKVAAKTAPVLETFKVIQTYPAYMGMPEAEVPAGNLTLVAGSKVRIEGRATQALSEASIQLDGINEKVAMKIGKPEDRVITGEFQVPREGLTGISLPLLNTEGVASQENTVYRVELVEDLVPEVEITAPTGDRLSVLLKAKPKIVYAAKDDYALKKLTLKYELSRPALTGGEEPPLEKGEIPLPLPQEGVVQQVYEWNLAAQKPAFTEGCTLSYWIEAQDNNDATGPGIGQTPKKTLAIVSEAEKRAELLEILGARASDIDEISNTQKKVNEDLDSTIRKNQP